MNLPRPGKVSSSVTAAILTLVLADGIAWAGVDWNSEETRKRAKLELTPTEAFRDIEGEADLRLSIPDQGNTEFKASATAEGEGIIEDAFYSLCIDDLFIDADEAEEIPLDEDEAIANFEAELYPSPFDELLGVTVVINLGIGCDGASVLRGLVTELE